MVLVPFEVLPIHTSSIASECGTSITEETASDAELSILILTICFACLNHDIRSETFRAYLEAYLSKHPYINQSMTLMVRQLPSSELGVPLELYCFCSQKEWTHYEKVQADIFDHVMAMMRVFDLRAYQRDNHLIPVSDREVTRAEKEIETKNGA